MNNLVQIKPFVHRAFHVKITGNKLHENYVLDPEIASANNLNDFSEFMMTIITDRHQGDIVKALPDVVAMKICIERRLT